MANAMLREERTGTTKKLMTPEELAERCGVSVNTIYWWKHKGMIGCVKLGKLLRFEHEAIEAFLAARRVAPTAR
jgi:excisionase family DNA binding protein